MEASFVDEQEVIAAIRAVRAGQDGANWMAVTYEGPRSQKLVLLGKGTGGGDELRTHLRPDIVVYGLVRVVDRVDESDTIKFCYVFFLGESVPRMQRARTSTQQHAVHAFLGQSHVDISATEPDEVSSAVCQSKVMVTSGTLTRVLDEGSTQAPAQAQVVQQQQQQSAATSPRRTEEGLALADEAAVRGAIAAVRSDSDPTTWALFVYDGAALSLVGTGAGTVDAEVAPQLREDAVMYALVRKTEQIDESTTTKFVWIAWTGLAVPRMVRARLSAHAAQIDVLFHPYHTSLRADRAGEVTDDALVAAIAKASGTANFVQETTKAAPKPQWQRRTTAATTPAGATATATAASAAAEPSRDALVFPEEVREALKEVRDDASPIQWAAAGIAKSTPAKTAALLGKGTEFGEMLQLLKADSVVWVLLRRTLQVDESATTKFVWIAWTGEDIPRMTRARLGTWSGAAMTMFTPYHVDIKCTELAEITEEIVTREIENAAGRADHVLA